MYPHFIVKQTKLLQLKTFSPCIIPPVVYSLNWLPDPAAHTIGFE